MTQIQKPQQTNNLPADPSKIPRVIRPLEKTQTKPLNERIIKTSPQVAAERLEICKKCSTMNDWACKITNKFMPMTVRLKTSACPKGYWSANWDVNK